MEKQLSIDDWLSEPYLDSYEIDEKKDPKLKDELRKHNEKIIARNKSNMKQVDMVNKENYYALLVAILRDDIKGADDAFHAMGLHRQHSKTQSRLEC